ncbi:MAG: hypothetical protein NZ763_03235 [Candidatus Marinimicrobia bacterium]|jgi:hypothetical protein|nr:hypothetical protein [Candidatus Neomarinimicrobiota bacterium]
MEFANTWLPFIYLYGVGGIAFVVGMLLILRTKALQVSFDRHKKWLWVLIYGFLFYAGLHATFILLAIGSY